MLKFYYHPSPNPAKVALLLEELGTPYEMVPVDTRKGDQHQADFLKINPNAKTPAIEDDGVPVFDSTAILMYLAEKHGKFQPTDPKLRGQFLSWMMFVASGVGPYSGQAVHFTRVMTTEEYATKRYTFEAKRHWGILDAHLAGKTWMIGDEYSILDMAVWGWGRAMPYVLGDEAAQFGNVTKLVETISARPAAERTNALKERATFKQEMDDDAKRMMFPSMAA